VVSDRKSRRSTKTDTAGDVLKWPLKVISVLQTVSLSVSQKCVKLQRYLSFLLFNFIRTAWVRGNFTLRWSRTAPFCKSRVCSNQNSDFVRHITFCL